MKRFSASDRFGIFLAMVVAMLFGMYPPSIRGLYADGGNITFAIIVAACARASILTCHCLLTKKPMFQTREDIIQAMIGGVCQAFSGCATMVALSFTPAPIVIMVIFTHTLMLLFFMIWKGEVKLDSVTLTTTVAALVGLSFVLDIWHTQSAKNLWGIAIAFGAALSTVGRMYVYGRQTRERNPAVVGAENLLMAAIFTLPVMWVQIPHAPASAAGYGWAALACSASALAAFLMFYGISFMGSFRWSLFSKAEPIFTALFSVILIHEILKPYQYAGMVIVAGSLIVYQWTHKPQLPVPAVVAAETQPL